MQFYPGALVGSNTCHWDPAAHFRHGVLHVVQGQQRVLVAVQLHIVRQHDGRDVERLVQDVLNILSRGRGSVLLAERTTPHRGHGLLGEVQPQYFGVEDAVAMIVNAVRILKYFLLVACKNERNLQTYSQQRRILTKNNLVKMLSCWWV